MVDPTVPSKQHKQRTWTFDSVRNLGAKPGAADPSSNLLSCFGVINPEFRHQKELGLACGVSKPQRRKVIQKQAARQTGIAKDFIARKYS